MKKLIYFFLNISVTAWSNPMPEMELKWLKIRSVKILSTGKVNTLRKEFIFPGENYRKKFLRLLSRLSVIITNYDTDKH